MVCGAVLGVAGVVLIVRYGSGSVSSDYQCVTEDSGSSQVIVIPTIQHTRIESTNPCNVKCCVILSCGWRELSCFTHHNLFQITVLHVSL